jgi:hypothetical protein
MSRVNGRLIAIVFALVLFSQRSIHVPVDLAR